MTLRRAVPIAVGILLLVMGLIWAGVTNTRSNAHSAEVLVEGAVVVPAQGCTPAKPAYELQLALQGNPEIVVVKVDEVYKRLDLVPSGSKVPEAKMSYRQDGGVGRLIIVGYREGTTLCVRAQTARQWLREVKIYNFTTKAETLVLLKDGEINTTTLAMLIASQKDSKK